MKLFAFFLLVLFSAPITSALATTPKFRVALILDKGGRDDKSFNSAAYAGGAKARTELGIMLKYVETMDDAAVETTMRSFAAKNYDLIVAIGFSMKDAIAKVAAQFPQAHFVLVDAEAKLPNVRSLLFDEHQGSYLVGAIAGLTSKSDKVGFIGGMDVPLIRRFQLGFEAGVKKVNPKARVINNYVGVMSDAWNNPAKAKELALSQYNQGVDVIFAAAGASNYGLFDAAEEKKRLSIGVDSNQNWVKPGFVLTSMLKRVDIAVYDTINEAKSGKFVGGVKTFGLKNQGVDYAVDEFNEKLLSPEVRKKVEALKSEIVAGKIKVPDYYQR
ncbi:MAG: BMP family ABC transporter substrate-binding protein [Proteobacteria bacterium]|nr:MAG: BMP family ABC transporter substrate-binding protein [Pseudomonadota bacterium]